jgi:phosphoserine phosphatase
LTKLILTRHGHVEGIVPPRFRGHVDLELTARGSAEAKRLGDRIAALWKPGALFCSPLKRSMATARAIGADCGLKVEMLSELNDIDYGSWQYQTFDDVKTRETKLYEVWFSMPERVRFPGGESLQDVAARTADATRHILSHHRDETVVVVAHDSVNRVLLSQLLGMPLSAYWRLAQDDCCINEIDITAQSARLIRMNDTGHLEGMI